MKSWNGFDGTDGITGTWLKSLCTKLKFVGPDMFTLDVETEPSTEQLAIEDF
jgi:hypothetical protein